MRFFSFVSGLLSGKSSGFFFLCLWQEQKTERLIQSCLTKSLNFPAIRLTRDQNFSHVYRLGDIMGNHAERVDF